MQKIKSSRSNRLIQIGVIVLGIAICTILGISFVVLDKAGAFTQASWKLLDSPLEFEHIADATTRKVWVVTDDNKYYCLGSPGCDQWMETEKVSVNSHEEYDHTTISKNTCKSDVFIKYPRDPQGNVVECAFSIVYFGVETRWIAYYALLDDGTIWVWKSSGPWYMGLGMFIMLVSPFIGLFLGLIAFRVFEKRQNNRDKVTD
jgi:hypothetical protein